MNITFYRKLRGLTQEKLAEKLGCPVVVTVSTSADGLKEVIDAANLVVSHMIHKMDNRITVFEIQYRRISAFY